MNPSAPWPGLTRYQAQTNLKDALRVFFEQLDAQQDRIDATVRRAEAIYAGQPLDRPFFRFDVTGLPYHKPSPWAVEPPDRIADATIGWKNRVHNAAGAPVRLRPRRRFCQPRHVKSVVVDELNGVGAIEEGRSWMRRFGIGENTWEASANRAGMCPPRT